MLKIKYFLSIILNLFFVSGIFAFQAKEIVKKQYFQQEVNTTIHVTLDDVNHKLNGNITIEYINNSPDVLSELYIHLWGNAYKDRTTAFAKQQLKNRNTKFHFASEESRGNFEGIAFQVNGKDVSFSYYEDNQDIAYIKLPIGLQPHEKLVLTTPLNLKIPSSFSRLGHVGTSYQMTQWFPKPAVYDQNGWHQMPYLNQGEFYSEFGSYDVSITLPDNYVIASTGTIQDDSEISFLNKKIEETKLKAQDTIVDISFPESSSTMKTVRYIAENCHDFGWFADKRFYVEKGEVILDNGKFVETYVFYTDTEKKLWQDALGYVNRAVKFYSEKVGNYPYPQATAVQSALSAGGGMEYPMITVIGTMGDPQSLDGVITHEVGHNWFYGILGFNERDHPWLDEGFNSYYDHRYDQMFYDSPSSFGLPKFLTKNAESSMASTLLRGQIKRGHDQAPSLHSADFESTNYFFSCYEKPAIAIEFLEQYLGAEKFDEVMHSLYEIWEFKHPGPDDVIAHFNEKSGEDLNWFFDGFIKSTDEVNYKISSIKKEGENYKISVSNKGDVIAPFPITAYQKGKAVVTQWYPSTDKSQICDFPYGDYDYFVIDSSYTMLDINMDNNYKKTKGIKLPALGFFTGMDQKNKKQLFLNPALGFNGNDGFMLGINLHNLSVPFPKWKFSINTMYGFNSQKIVGTARIQYDQPIKKGKLQRISYKLSSKQFSLSDNTAIDYATIVPSINFRFVHAPGSLWTSDLLFKNSFVRLSGYSLGEDQLDPIDNSYSKLSYAVNHNHVLNPFNAKIGAELMNYVSKLTELEEKNNTVKIDLDVEQSYTIMRGKKITGRFYGAFFPVTANNATTSNNPFYGSFNNNINLIYNSFSDHAYEDLFFDRGNQAGHQVVLKEGAFKVSNADPSNLGQSDRAAYAINLVSDIPIKKVPDYFKLYFDYGSYLYTGTTTQERTWQNMYSGGVMINMFDAVAIYLPIINSDNIQAAQSGNYFSKISFTFDLNKMDIVDLYNNYRL